jgi:hypothetical protein
MFLIKRGVGAAAKLLNLLNPSVVVRASVVEAKLLNKLLNKFNLKSLLS